MIANAVLSIVSSVIGGSLVLAGQFFVKRAEDKRVWLIRLQKAASDLATSYLQEAATVNCLSPSSCGITAVPPSPSWSTGATSPDPRNRLLVTCTKGLSQRAVIPARR